MEEPVRSPGSDLGTIEEAELIVQIDKCFESIEKLQTLFLPQMSEGDLVEAEGRKCILVMKREHQPSYSKYFEVTPVGVKMVDPYDVYDTTIEAPVESVLNVLKAVLDGKQDAFTSEWARGKCRITGSRKLHDGYIFGQVFARLARVIQVYRKA
jgi:hypothetical protein